MADSAESVVLRLEAQTSDHDTKIRNSGRVVEQATNTMSRSVDRAESEIRSSAVVISRSFDQVGQRSRLLGYQISDIGVQLASGTNPFLILAQQAPQVANALEGVGGVAGRLAAFFSGPWGAALLAAGSVVAVLASNMGDAETASGAHETAAKSLTQAIRDQEEATRKATQTSQQAEAQNYAEAQSQLEKARRVREATVALLQQAYARLRSSETIPGDPSGGLNFGVAVGGTQEAAIARISRLLVQNEVDLRKQETVVRRGQMVQLQRQAAEATDAATAATGRYDRALGALNSRYERGKISDAAYRQELENLNRTRDKEVDAANKSERAGKKDTEAKRAAAKAAREAAKAQKELEQTLDTIVGKYDPARAAAEKFMQSLADIDKLQAEGLLTYVEAIEYKIKAAAEQADAIAKRATQAMEEAFGYKIGSNDDPIEDAKRRVSNTQDENIRRFEEEDEKRRRIEESRVRDIAMLYEDLMTGGVEGVWDSFKRIGIQMIAETLAKSTLAQFGKIVSSVAGSGQGGSAGEFFSSVFGRASGGYVAPGQVVRINEGGSVGRAEGFRAPGKGGTIIPLGRMNPAALGASAGTTIVNQHFNLDARYGITSTDLIEYVNNTVTTMGQAAVKQSRADLNALARPRL